MAFHCAITKIVRKIVGNSYEQLYARVIASYNLIKRADISKFKQELIPKFWKYNLLDVARIYG